MAIRQRYWEVVPGTYPEDPPRERLTPAGAEYLIQHQSPPPKDYVRADSAGLRMIEHHDEANRPHRTFELAPGATKRDTWMAPYMAQPQLQIRICKDGHAPGSPEANAYQARWEATQAMIASGNITLPEV